MSWISDLFGGGQPGIYALEGRTAQAAAYDVFSIPMVVATRQLVADTVASFDLIEVDETGERVAGRTPLILEQPDPLEPRSDTLERLVNDMTRWGRGWLRVTARDKQGLPLAVELVSDRRCVAVLDPSGARIEALSIDGRPQDMRDIRQSPMILDDGPLGRSPLLEISDVLRQLALVYTFAAEMYGAGATPNYAILSPTRLPPDTAEALMQQWLEARAANRPAMLSGDLSLQTFSGQTAADAMLEGMIDRFDSTIARAMQIPPSIVNALAQSSLTYSTTRDELARWLISLNTGYLHRLEVVFSSLLPRGRSAKFITSSLTRLDESEALANAVTAYQAGIITLTEARGAIGREDTPNGGYVAS